MKIHFIRHATFVFEMGGLRLLVDPMLGEAGAAPAVPNTPNQRPNPLVGLPFGDDDVVDLVETADAVLVTHTHNDHWDGRAQELVPKGTLIIRAAERLGFELRETSVGGASDGNFAAAMGRPVLDGLGAVGGGAHARHEHVSIAGMIDRGAVAAGVLTALARP